MKENPENLNIQAIEFASRGEYKEAIACFKRALSIQNKNHLLWYNLGITYRDAGELQKAKDSLLTAFKLSPENESIIETLAHICFLLSEYTEALSFCEEGLSVNPINHHLWNNSGVIYFATDDYEKACEAFEKAVTIDPNYYDALYNLRDTYIQLGNDIGAKECARRLKTMSVGDFYAQ